MLSKNIFRQITAGAALTAALGFGSIPSFAYEAFTVVEDGYVNPLVPALCGGSCTFTADQFEGQYQEVLTTTIPGAFVTSGIFSLSGPSLLNVPQDNWINNFLGYQLYALFQFNGTTGINAAGDITFTAIDGSASLWVDPNRDSRANVVDDATGAAVPTFAGTSGVDDIELGFATSLLSGEGFGRIGDANGDFDIKFDNWTLTAAGMNYFILPKDFYMVVDINGNFQNLNPIPECVGGLPACLPIANATYFLDGAGQVYFEAVPEPGSLALIALGLLALGFGGRRLKA